MEKLTTSKLLKRNKNKAWKKRIINFVNVGNWQRMSVKKRGPELPCPHLIWFLYYFQYHLELVKHLLSCFRRGLYGFPADDDARRLVFSPRMWIIDLGAPQRYLFSCIPRGLLDFQQQSVGTRCSSRTEKLPDALNTVFGIYLHIKYTPVRCLYCVLDS
jgi:hypothetical protein